MEQSINLGGKELQDTISQVMRRASVDADFRSLALTNPQAAIAQVHPGLADATSLRFAEASPNTPAVTLTFALPELANVEELSEAELEQVAGGGVSDVGSIHIK